MAFIGLLEGQEGGRGRGSETPIDHPSWGAVGAGGQGGGGVGQRPPPGGPFWAAMVNGGLGGGCVARSPPTAHPAAPLLVLPWVRAPQ